ncbi:hypothetical protein RUM44_007961 [Polyplax serrata]|uniref:E3 ubiquitin-protein ligase n=1 Tax=Polyplax serrata TaxID=468196 RepID=A0ABR1B8S9_POLSC
MEEKPERSHLSFIDDGEMDIPLAHLPKYTESPKNIIDIWLEKMGKGQLTPAHFKDHWRIWVPKLYALEPGSEWNLENDKSNCELLDNLEKFIANGDFKEVMEWLNCRNQSSSVCGKVFKMHEPLYTCRECGMDLTCVLCVTCFKNSAHRNHNYKMASGMGGGCCDCGDVEAWKKDPFCDIHSTGNQVKNDTQKYFPADMIERCKVTFTGILKYAFQVLTLEHSPGLPHDLRLTEAEEDPFGFSDGPHAYCTVLYNDEIHTFEQVINTLVKIVKCSQRNATEYVTNIDREGRAVVRCTSFQQCQELKTDIERFTSKHGGLPLKVDVVHTHVIAHQVFAMKLLRWLQKILLTSEHFRLIFTIVALTPIPPDTSIVEGILLRDSRLWKSARSHWHRLFISGMLMEYNNKKALAGVFTKNYGTVIKDFINDDHDHSFSIASLSVQIFTTPTLTHHLIAEGEVLFILFHTFMSECSRKFNKAGKLHFERNVSNQSFKRAQYILYDLKYLFSSVPTESQWTDNLRRGFLQGFSSFLNLLACMQGMDSVTRQIIQHMEFEPVWEAAFQLHIKLSLVISLIIKWCGSDRVVLIKAFRATLVKLNECGMEIMPVMEVRELADHSANCIQFDVATQPVSIHLPLSRFLAGLYLLLEKHNLTFDSPEFQATVKPSPEQIIEPVLRTQVMIAQVHSAMWRRNGYSLLNQLYLYHSVRCRTEMLDRDIVMLQIGATLIPSDEFLIHLLNKFNLLNWADPDFEENSLKNREEDIMHQTISLVEEFLGLLIVIVGERTIPGVGKVTRDDQIKKQIIQQLCIKPMAHSELNKTLPDDVNLETGLEKVVDEVAVFKKPSQSSDKGVYELKPELYDQYNIFFYHYTKEELSKSEEEQRKRRKAAGQLECCPPPKLAPLTDAFSMLPNLLQCDVMFYIIQTVLKRCINLRARSFSEHQLQKVLHLIGYALQEEESKTYPYLCFAEKSVKWSIEKLLEELLPSARVEAHKDMLTWTLNKFKQVKATKENIEEPVLMSASQGDSSQGESSGKDSKERRAKMAAEKRAKILAQMAAMQKSFMMENAKLFENTVSYPEKSGERVSMMDCTESDERDPIALGPNQTVKFLSEKTFTCILCQEDSTVSVDGPALVSPAFIQKSTVHANSRIGMEKPDEVLTDPLFLPTNLRPQPHTSICSHVMHSSCWRKYFDIVLAKENRRPYRLRQPMGFDIEKKEFFCPLCECLSNAVLPILPPLGAIKPSTPAPEVSFEAFIDGLVITLKHKGRQKVTDTPISLVWEDTDEEPTTSYVEPLLCTCPLDKVQTELGEASGATFASLFPQNEPPKLSQSLVDMILFFAHETYAKGLNVIATRYNFYVPVMAWNTCYYTILSTESLLTDQDKPLMGALSSRQKDCLENLTRFAGVLGAVWERASEISNNALFLLSMILDGNSKTQELPCILDWDSFGLLVPLTLSLPNIYGNSMSGGTPAGGIPTGGVLELYTLKLVFLSHITKILLTTEFQGREMENDDFETAPSLSQQESEVLLNVLSNIKKTCNYDTSDVWQLNAEYVWETVKRACLPFLRCCALFYHFLTDVQYPACLAELGGDTYEELCKYLALPVSLTELFETSKYKDLMTGWLTHERVPACLSSKSFVSLPKAVNGLVVLPRDYSELINMVSTFTCPNSDRDDTRNPTMCLVCGEMLCSQSYCCQQDLSNISVGACTFHAHRCGANCGIFLRVRECEILLLATPNRGCCLPAPYLDRYGEADPGLSRGNPLTLSQEQYRKLKLLWLSHGIYEKIARAIESSNNVLTTQWQNL